MDLNSYLYRMELNLARLHELQATASLLTFAGIGGGGGSSSSKAKAATGSEPLLMSEQARAYAKAADRRALAMDAFMWSDEEGCWRDHVVVPPVAGGRAAPGAGVVSASNFLPLWAHLPASPALPDGARKGLVALETLTASGLVQAGGVQTTLERTAEQWDAPNAWAPVQQMIIEGLELLGSPEASAAALSLAKAWLESNYLGWANTGQMHEKYNAKVPGARGEGGEYLPQLGFGWTNGVLLHLLSTYGETLSSLPAPPVQEEAPAIELKAVADGSAGLAAAERRKDEERRDAGSSQ